MSTAADPLQDELGPISPELVLVDPELARALRSRPPSGSAQRLHAAPVGERRSPLAETRQPARTPRHEPASRRARGAGARRHWQHALVAVLGLGTFVALGLDVAPSMVAQRPTLDVTSGPVTSGPVTTSPVTTVRPATGEATSADRAPTGSPEPPRAGGGESKDTTSSPPAGAGDGRHAAPSDASRRGGTKAESARSTPETSRGVGAAPPTRGVVALTWSAAPGATAYRFELVRDGRVVLVSVTRRRSLVVPRRWVYRQNPTTLEAGRYTWRVWQLGADGTVGARPLVRASLDVAGGRPGSR